MSEQPRVYLTRKRHRDEENKQQSNHQQNAAETEAERDLIRMKLTKVNIDCLEIVFMHLSFADLLNVADANKELKPAADLAFTRKFGQKLFTISIYGRGGEIQFDEGPTKIFDFKTCLQTLRCFGHLISRMYIETYITTEHSKRLKKVFQYINQYCSKSVSQIKFGGIANIFKYIKKPFLNAKTVTLSNCIIENEDINKWFPKMYSLALLDAKMSFGCIKMHFNHMQRLEISGITPTSDLANILCFLRLNPQLRNLKLDTGHALQLIRCVSENLHLLEDLDVGLASHHFPDDKDEVIAIKQLKRLRIDFDFDLLSNLYIPISSEQLEEFSCVFTERKVVDDFIDFLKRHPSIVKLNVEYFFDFTTALVLENIGSQIIKVLPLLQEVNFVRFELAIEVIIPFTKHAPLKTFRSQMDPIMFDELKQRLDNEWQAMISDNRVNLQRKN